MSAREGDQESEIRGPSRGPSSLHKANARPKNWLMPVMLVSLRQWNSYGYELMKQATTLGLEATNPGTFYRTLRRLEENGMVKSTWETPDGKGRPARRMYSITEAGEAYLDFWAKGLEQYQQMLDAFFGLYTRKPPRRGENRAGPR